MYSTYILHRLHNAAQLSTQSTMAKRHGAVLYNGKKCIGKGYNSYGSNIKVVSCHAEISAMVNSLKRVNQSSLLACKKRPWVLWR